MPAVMSEHGGCTICGAPSRLRVIDLGVTAEVAGKILATTRGSYGAWTGSISGPSSLSHAGMRLRRGVRNVIDCAEKTTAAGVVKPGVGRSVLHKDREARCESYSQGGSFLGWR